MDFIKSLTRSVMFCVGCAVITSCSFLLKPQPPAPFEKAISTLASGLLDQVEAVRPLSHEKSEINVMIIPFTDADSDEVPVVSRSIETIMIEVGTQNFEGFHLARLTSKNVDDADYIIRGTIRLDAYRSRDAETFQKYYRVSGEVMDVSDKKIIGESSVWISDKDLNYAPTAIYRDSPLYLKGSRVTRSEKIQHQTLEEDLADVSLKTRALQIEGRMAYENGDYEAARTLFEMATQREDGQDLATYAGLYLTNYKLGRFEAADKAFEKVVSISAETYRFFTVKYLFGVNSVEFLQDENLKARYDTWIRNIGKYLQKTNHCLQIVGHASRTGTKTYNDQLSLDRAKNIQKLLQETFPEVFQRSEVVGKGFSENIVGTGTDDEHDVLDRRVELFIVKCH